MAKKPDFKLKSPARFKLLAGIHAGRLPDGTKHVFKAKEPDNNIITSDTDLEAQFGSDKYQNIDRLGGSGPGADALKKRIKELEAELALAQGKPSVVNPMAKEDLEEMTVPELRKFAEDMEIDLGTATRKEEIVNTIKAAMDSA